MMMNNYRFYIISAITKEIMKIKITSKNVNMPRSV